MLEQWTPLLISLLAACVTVSGLLFGNHHLQKKLLFIHNKEKMIDLLVDTVNELKDLYIEYWGKTGHDDTCSLKIKARQTWLLDLFDAIHEKYTLANELILHSKIKDLIVYSTGDEFDTVSGFQPRPDKCIKASKFANKIIIEMIRNKI